MACALAGRCLSQSVTGAFLNGIGILLGSLFGLAWRRPLSTATQNFFKVALGLFTLCLGVRLVWISVGGTFSAVLKQILAATIAIIVGHLVGKWLGLQKISNRLGRHASRLIACASSNQVSKTGEGFNACVALFCAAPLGLIGAVTDGLSGFFYLLAVKALMDGLAMMSFVRFLRWPAALSAFPVFLFLSAITLACQLYARPFLEARHLLDSVNAAAGLVACAVALVIFEVRKVELANFLPSLVIAPLLVWLLK